MNWPTSQDYNEAIQNAASSFADPGLKSGEVTLNALGLPAPRSGNFADVYQFKGGDGKMWAVKCFTRKIAGLQERYAKIDDHLAKVKLPFTVGFKYFEEGIRVRGQWFPLLKMEWVEGFTLNEFVRNNADKPKYLHALMQMWAKLTARLREGNLAHADLQHGNVLLVPGDSANKLGLKLIDYDGMWVPALADAHSGEIGHPNFQHPLRLKGRLYNADVDRFPHLVVACALRATLLGGKALWDRFDNGDNLLFKEPDLADQENAEVFQTLWNLHDDVLCTLLGKLAIASQDSPLGKTPWLDEMLLGGGGQRLSDRDEQRVTRLLGVDPHFSASNARSAASAVDEFSDFEVVDDDDEPAPKKATDLSKSRKSKAQEKSKSKLPLFIGGGVLAVCLIGGLIALTTGGGKSNPPSEVAKNVVDDAKPKNIIAPDKKDVPKTRVDDPKKIAPKTGKEDVPPPVDKKPVDIPNIDRKAGEVMEVEIARGVMMKFCWVPAGEAQLGSPKAERNEVLKFVKQENKDPETLSAEAEEARGKFKTKGFWLAKYTVTQGEWESLMGKNPSHYSKKGKGKNKVTGLDTNRFPVEQVSWNDCQEYLTKLNSAAKPPGPIGNGKFALPHEDEWEYACRGGKGNAQAFYFGDELNGRQANCDGSHPYGTTTKGIRLERTAAVGSYENLAPHPWGLCDMTGNVWQWCANWLSQEQNAIYMRGGSFDYKPWQCRSAYRNANKANNRQGSIGVRIAFHPNELVPAAGKQITEPNDKKIADADNNARRPGAAADVEIGKDLTMTFCWIPAGEAQLGSPSAERQEVMKLVKGKRELEWLSSEAEELRGAFKTRSFWLGKYPVTPAEWETVVGANPTYFSKDGAVRSMFDTTVLAFAFGVLSCYFGF